MAPATPASGRAPTDRARQVAVATITAACRQGHIDLDEAEGRLSAVYAAQTYADLYQATAGLPHPPAPFVVGPDR